MQKEKFSFRVGPKLGQWLRGQPSISKTVNEALKRYQSGKDWRETENKKLAEIVTEFTRIGSNINQMARTMNTAEVRGEKAKGLEDLIEVSKELRATQSELGKLLRIWNS